LCESTVKPLAGDGAASCSPCSPCKPPRALHLQKAPLPSETKHPFIPAFRPAESSANELPSVFWFKLALEARRPRGKRLAGSSSKHALPFRLPACLPSFCKPPTMCMLFGSCRLTARRCSLVYLSYCVFVPCACAANEALERDMFGLVWGPTLAAVSVVLDNASDMGAVRRALDCLLLAARMAAYHQVGRRGGGDLMSVGSVVAVRVALQTRQEGSDVHDSSARFESNTNTHIPRPHIHTDTHPTPCLASRWTLWWWTLALHVGTPHPHPANPTSPTSRFYASGA